MADELEHAEPVKPANASNLAGTTLGKYRLVEKIGQGGMAQVYKAYQANLDRHVAVKILHPYLTGDEEFLARFRREARAIATLEHPHCVRVYDFDTIDGLSFLVMEHLAGETLKMRLRQLHAQNARMEIPEIQRVVGSLADALDHAHRHGIVHRDVKPANIILTDGGRPVLTDFGIARLIDSTLITSSDGTMGTPAYMSPEQGKGEPGDARSDIYALGVILYQLCTGHLPFDADTPYAIILKQLTEPLPSPRSLRPDLPQAFERIILKAMAKNPDDRFQTAGEMGTAIRAAIEPQSIARILPSYSISSMVKSLAGILRRKATWRSIGLITFTALICIVLFFVSIPWRQDRFVARNYIPTTITGSSTLILEGPEVVVDTWLDPDNPDTVWQTRDRAQLRGSKDDRLLMGFGVAMVPPEATIISATLTLRIETNNPQFVCRIVAYRMATIWKPSNATFNSPWNQPGLQAGVDYESTPVERVTMPTTDAVTLNIAPVIVGWQKRGRVGGGLVLMLSDDSVNQCFYTVYLTEQANSADRPTLRIVYKASP